MVRFVLLCVVVCSAFVSRPVFAQEEGKPIHWAVDSYIHAGMAIAKEGPGRDDMRMLALFAVGGSYFPASWLSVRLAGGSLLGLIVPSIETSLATELYPFGATRTSPFVRLGVRGVLNVGVECGNHHASCEGGAEMRRENRPADAFGPILGGVLAEAGVGMQFRLRSKTAITVWGSYIGGPANLLQENTVLLEKPYHGALITGAVRFFIAR